MATIDADLSAPAPRAEARRDRDIRDERVHSHLGLAHQLARRFGNRGETHDDLVQVASLALVRAAERFDPDRGVMFSTFAAASIVGELKRHFRDRGWAVRAPAACRSWSLRSGAPPTASARAGAGADRSRTGQGDPRQRVRRPRSSRSRPKLPHLLAGRPDREGQSMAESLGSEDGGFVGVENHSALAKAMGTLSPRDRDIVRLRFVEGLTQSQIATQLGVSQMQISRLLAASLRRLRSNIEARKGHRRLRTP